MAPFAAGGAQLRRLGALAAGGDALYAGIYGGVLDMVKNNDGFAEFCAALDALPAGGERRADERPAWMHACMKWA